MKEKLKKAEKNENILLIPLRYFCLLFISLGLYYSSAVYKILFLITVYPVYLILNIFQNSIWNGSFLVIGKNIIELIPACIAVSAYVFLFILNLATSMNYRIRIKSLIFAVFSLLIINILRIVILSFILIQGYPAFDILHRFTWYFLSLIIVIAIWFSSVKIFKIENIPVYSDFKTLLDNKK